MPLILDTFNVLHTVGVLPPDLAGIDVQGLIGLIHSSRYRQEKVILACDGKPKPELVSHDPSITIRFSGAGKPADDLIDQLVRASSAPRKLVIVSSDHAVQRTGRRRRCTVLTSEEFLAQLADDANLPQPRPHRLPSKPPAEISGDQVDRWIKVFDLDESIVSLPSKAPVEDDELEADAPATESSDESLDASQIEQDPNLADLLSDDFDEVKPVLPPSLIEQAERIWREQNPPTKNLPPKNPPEAAG
jgi:uncharacterized protein